MTLRKIEETQTDTITWAADGQQQCDLLKNGPVTELRATVEVTPSATLTAANQIDGLWRVIQNLQIQGGGRTYMTLPADDACMGGTLLHYMNQYDGFGPGHQSGSVTAPGARAYIPITFVLHAGSRPFDEFGRPNPFDLTAFIPSTLEGRLRAVWTTSGNDVMDDTVTITSATMRFTLASVLGSELEVKNEMAHQSVMLPPGVDMMVPEWYAEVHEITSTYSDYSLDRDMPPGAWTKRVCMAAQDATAIRSIRATDEVTGIKVKLVRDGSYLMQVFTDQMLANLPYGSNLIADSGAANNAGVATQCNPDFDAHAPQGIFIVDLRRHTTYENPWGRDYGINLTAPYLGTGDVKIGMTVSVRASGDDVLLLYERYMALAGRIV